MKDARVGPEKAESLVVFLHGYGADGADLLGLAEVLQPALPTTAFRAPDAPEPCRGNPSGRQWFPIPWLDGSDPVSSGQSLARSCDLLDRYISGVLAAEGLSAKQLVLFGFSQGTMMALQVGLQRVEALAGIVGFSGRLLADRLPKSKPPVLLVHGDQDQMVPFVSLAEAEAGLSGRGLAVETHVMAGVGHGISQDGLTEALRFLRKVLA